MVKSNMKKYKRIYIEITNNCNLSCVFCPEITRKKEYMDDDLFPEILKKIKGASEYLYFHVMGEPLLHPHLGYFLDLCGPYGYKVNLTTNGTLISKSRHILEKPALRQVNFSLHGSGGAGGYLQAILNFADEAQKAKKLVSLRLWNLRDNKPNPGNTGIIEKIREKYNAPADMEEKSLRARGFKLDEYVFLNQADEFEWPDMNREEISDKGYCYGLRGQIAILVDGTVVPCCLDSEGVINLGNIKEKTLEEIINGSRAKAIYDGFSSRRAVEELCRKCKYKSRFE
jgi:radical SAM protein with 4Fe4S-binding SPASM domain